MELTDEQLAYIVKTAQRPDKIEMSKVGDNFFLLFHFQPVGEPERRIKAFRLTISDAEYIRKGIESAPS